MVSIYSGLKQCAAENGGALPNDRQINLADHNDIEEKNRDLWVAGALEAELLRSTYDVRAKAMQNYKIAHAVKKQMKNPCEKNYGNMIKALSKYYTISIADPVLSFVSKEDKTAMRSLALNLIKESPKREIVKFGIVLLGHSGKTEDTELLKFIGSHDEFTLYAAAALKNIVSESEKDIYMVELADSTSSGWGKVAAILEINEEPCDSVKEWLLKKGCQCRIGTEYTACECAIKGGLVNKLGLIAVASDEEKLDFMKEYYAGICSIFEGLLKADKSNSGLDGLSEVDGIKQAVDSLRTLSKDTGYEEDSRFCEIFKDLEKIFA